MEYRKIANRLDSASNQPSKFRTKNWVEINDDLRIEYTPNKQIRFKTAMLMSCLLDYSDAYMLFKGNISVKNTGTAAAPTNRNKQVILKNLVPFNYCISKINNTEIDNTQYIDIVMPMYNLTEYSDNYSKATGSLWQYCKKIPAVNNEGKTAEFEGDTATDSCNFKTKTTGQADKNRGIDNVEIMVPLKYLINFWRTLEMPLINCKYNLF